MGLDRRLDVRMPTGWVHGKYVREYLVDSLLGDTGTVMTGTHFLWLSFHDRYKMGEEMRSRIETHLLIPHHAVNVGIDPHRCIIAASLARLFGGSHVDVDRVRRREIGKSPTRFSEGCVWCKHGCWLNDRKRFAHCVLPENMIAAIISPSFCLHLIFRTSSVVVRWYDVCHVTGAFDPCMVISLFITQ